jgi:hypothetical protein
VTTIATRIRMRVRSASTKTAGDRSSTAVNDRDPGTLTALSADESSLDDEKEES